MIVRNYFLYYSYILEKILCILFLLLKIALLMSIKSQIERQNKENINEELLKTEE
jgi:hypothetical protein